jgi:hypothetical protein
MSETNIEINPSTKVYDLLNTYPEFEETLLVLPHHLKDIHLKI